MGNQEFCKETKNTDDKLFEEIIVCGKQPQFRNSTTINIINNIPIINGPPLNFHKNGTFDKVQKSASQFCLHNQLDRSFVPLVARIIAYGHNNIFQAYQKLQPYHQEQFLKQIKYIDFEFLDSLYHNFILGQKQQHKYVTSPINIVTEEGIYAQAQNYRNIGKKIIKNQQVGIVLLCAGSSNRFQQQDKFLYPLSIKSEKTILQLYFQRIRKNFGIPEGHKANVVILIACNNQNRFLIEQYLKSTNHFGFNVSKIRYLTVKNLPVLDSEGKVCLTFEYKFLDKPCGTAKCVQEFLNSSSLNYFVAENISIVHIVGCQNLGENPGCPLDIGYLASHKLQLLGKCVDPIFPFENFTRFVSSKSRNYALGTERILKILGVRPQTILQKCPIAMNSMICNLGSLQKIVKDYNNSMFLSREFRVIKSKQNYFNFQKNRPQINQNINYFQKDIQHFFSCSENYKIIKIPREDFIPLLTKNSSYSLKEASKRLIQYHQRQIQATSSQSNTKSTL